MIEAKPLSRSFTYNGVKLPDPLSVDTVVLRVFITAWDQFRTGIPGARPAFQDLGEG